MVIYMFRLKARKYLGAIMVGALLLSSAPTFPNTIEYVAADELSDAQDKKDDAANKKKAAEERLTQLESDKKDIMELIEELDNEITGYETTIAELRDKKNNLQAQACITEDSLQMAYIAEQNQYESMKERIQFAYENGDSDYIGALLSIKEYSSVVNQSEYVSQVSSYDQKQLNDLLEIETAIYEYKESIQSNLDDIESVKVEAEGEQEALQVMQSGKMATLEEYNIQIADTEYTIEEMAAIEAQQDAEIAAIIAEAAARRAAAEAAAQQTANEQAAAEEQKKQEAVAQTQTASSTDATQQETQQTQQTQQAAPQTTTTQPASTMATYTGGRFTWPCPSSTYITSGFGAREAPTEGATTSHKGIDIGCSSGASIVAAADGVVAFVGYMGGGGNAVLIDHGNGITTCYFHLSGFAVSTGANVSAGQTVGYAGSTGVSTGPHLHFGVLLYGAYVDPMGYL